MRRIVHRPAPMLALIAIAALASASAFGSSNGKHAAHAASTQRITADAVRVTRSRSAGLSQPVRGLRDRLQVRAESPSLARGGRSEARPATAVDPVGTVPCPDVQSDALCGRVDVPLDRLAPAGGSVPIAFVLLPHTDTSSAALEPVFIILGGPGDAASAATWIAERNFAGERDHRDVVLVDYRGEGRSNAIVCQPLQQLATDDAAAVIDAAGACGAQLGDASDRYGAGDVADDLDDVRAALGYPKIDLYGISYGTVQAQAYALRHGTHLRALVLDGAISPLDTAGNWEIGTANAVAVANDIALVCRRSPSCSGTHPAPAQTIARLAARLRRHPVDGAAQDATGAWHTLHVDEGTLVRMAIGTDPLYTTDGELVAAATSLRHGDSAPLLRLAANAPSPLFVNDPDPTVFSAGLNAAAQCTDFPLPWDLSAPFAQRRAQFDAAIAHLSFGPFTPSAWAENGGFSGYCLKWPAPDDLAAVFTPGARFPDVPVLVVAAQLDTSTPLAQGRFVAGEFPRAQLIVLRNGGHAPGFYARCIPDIYARFVTTLGTGDTTCLTSDDSDRPALAGFPRRVREARKATARRGDHSRASDRRLATVVWDTVEDSLRQSFRLPADGSGPGLRGGTFDAGFDDTGAHLDLHGLRFSTDAAVDGHVDWTYDTGAVDATVTVTAPGASAGTLNVHGRWFGVSNPAGEMLLDGRLAGRTIALSTPGG